MKTLAQNLYKVTLTNKAMRTSSRNLYIIKGDDRSLMIDTSWKVPECLNDMENALKELSIDYKDLDIFVTHNHADHSGYVSCFTDRGARAFMNPVEITEASDRYHRLYEDNTMRRSYTRECGVTKELAPDAWQEINTGADRLAKENNINFNFPFTPISPGDIFPCGDFHFEAVPLCGPYFRTVRPRGTEQKAFLLRRSSDPRSYSHRHHSRERPASPRRILCVLKRTGGQLHRIPLSSWTLWRIHRDPRGDRPDHLRI